MDSALSKARAAAPKTMKGIPQFPKETERTTCILNYAERDRKIVGSQIGLNKALMKKTKYTDRDLRTIYLKRFGGSTLCRVEGQTFQMTTQNKTRREGGRTLLSINCSNWLCSWSRVVTTKKNLE